MVQKSINKLFKEGGFVKILVTTSTFSEKTILESYPDIEAFYNPYGRRLTESEAIQLIIEYQPVGIIAGVEPLSKKVLAAAEHLRVISRCGIGLDSVDLKAAEDLGITVINTPIAPVSAVAEMVLALMFTWLRKTAYGDQQIRAGQWEKKKGQLLSGKKIGILGCGNIGTYLANILLSMGCTVYGYDPYVVEKRPFQMLSLRKLFSQSDIVSLHVPMSEKTRNMINRETLRLMKPTALLINTSRGGTVHEDDLYEAISGGIIAGAALDVFNEEPYKGKLKELGDSVVLSPHQGSNTKESRKEMELESISNLLKKIEEIGQP